MPEEKGRHKGPSLAIFLQADLTGVLWPDTFGVRHAISLKDRKQQNQVQWQ